MNPMVTVPSISIPNFLNLDQFISRVDSTSGTNVSINPGSNNSVSVGQNSRVTIGNADFIGGTSGPENLNVLAGNDQVRGFGGNDRLNGSLGNDTLFGDDGHDLLVGGAGKDRLVGGSHDDLIIGGEGSDLLSGGTGRDRFRFDSVGDRFDRITDFDARDDLILLSGSGFNRGLDRQVGSALLSARFVLGTRAKDPNNRLIYDRSKGALFYDSDGSGSRNQVLLAVLQNKPSINSSDIYISA